MKTKPLSGELWGEALWNTRKCHKCEKEKDRKYTKKSIIRDSIICFQKNLLILQNDTLKHYHLSVFPKKSPHSPKLFSLKQNGANLITSQCSTKPCQKFSAKKNCSIWIKQVLTKHVRKLCSSFSILYNHCPNNYFVCYHPYIQLCLRDGWRYQIGCFSGKVPEGGGGVIFNPKIYIADFGPLHRFFWTFCEILRI